MEILNKYKPHIIKLAVICFTVLMVIYIMPMNINETYDAVIYRLGEENKSYTQDSAIMVKGMYFDNIFTGKKFKGIIYIKNHPENDEAFESYVSDYIKKFPKKRTLFNSFALTNSRDFDLKFDRLNRYILRHSIYSSKLNKFVSYDFGEIYINNKFNKITIAISENREGTSTVWTSDDGLMVSAPADDRASALAITNELIDIRYKNERIRFE